MQKEILFLHLRRCFINLNSRPRSINTSPFSSNGVSSELDSFPFPDPLAAESDRT